MSENTKAKVAKTLADYQATVDEAKANYAAKVEGAAAALERTLMTVAAEMSAAGFTNVEIAQVTGKSKGHIGKVIVAGMADKRGYDHTSAVAAVTGSKVTLSALREMLAIREADKRDAALSAVGIVTKANAARKGKQTRKSGDEQNADALAAIVKRVNDGKADYETTIRAFQKAANQMKAARAKRDAEADMD